jgi:hypothetical protein
VGADIHDIFARGGKGLVDFLDYCVRSVKMDPVFIFLVSEYRAGPTALKAIALYDCFCAPEALWRVRATTALPPRDLRLLTAVQPLKDWSAGKGSHPAEGRPPPLPAKFLFDAVAAQLESDPENEIRRVGLAYDPAKTPFENLPNGGMSAGQRAFVENIWHPILRPRLVAAGFRRITNIA